MHLRHSFFAAAAFAALLLPAAAQSKSATFSNSVDAYFEVPYNDTVVPTTGLTIEAWLRYDETTLGAGSRWPTVMRQNQNGGQESFFLRVDAGSTKNTNLRFLVNTVGSGVRTADWNFGPGGLLGWTHVAATYDGAQAVLFVDGVQVATVAATGPLVNNGGTLRIGKGSDSGSPSEVWNGALDEVRLWPFARTAQEIQQTRNLELSSLPGKVSTWNLDGNGLDSSGANSMTLFGTPQVTAPAPGLSAMPFTGLSVGAGTAGCSAVPAFALASMPIAGTSDFSMMGQSFSPGSSAVGYVTLGTLGAPFPFLGIDIWVDPLSAIGLFPTSTDPLGNARLTMPIPPGLPAGFNAAVQFLAFDLCGPQGMTASNAMIVVITS